MMIIKEICVFIIGGLKMIKRKKYMIGLLVMALSISFANSKVALAESNSASTMSRIKLY